MSRRNTMYGTYNFKIIPTIPPGEWHSVGPGSELYEVAQRLDGWIKMPVKRGSKHTATSKPLLGLVSSDTIGLPETHEWSAWKTMVVMAYEEYKQNRGTPGDWEYKWAEASRQLPPYPVPAQIATTGLLLVASDSGVDYAYVDRGRVIVHYTQYHLVTI